ncbi:hypothetical protein WJX84_004781 [Apatococcus fuscideae]|uniref:Uncharacterized protein n=1 Tax=Apatococcus fuscideae TaxID=2026836 RepID=A0AAW1TCR5_9CHLO
MAGSSLRQRRRKTALLSAGAVSIAGLLIAYRYYQSIPKSEGEPELSYLQRFKLALKRYSDAFLLGSDLASGILRDLHTFVQSDSSEVPQSIRQLARLLQSREVAQSTSALTAAVFRGIVDPQQNNPARAQQASDRLQEGAATASSEATGLLPGLGGSLASRIFPAVARSRAHEADASGRLQDTVTDAVRHPDAAEKLLNALTSERGKDLVSLVVSVAVRTSTREVCRCYERISQRPAQGPSSSPNPTEQHKEFIEQMVRASIREGVYAAFGRSPPHLARRSQPSVHIAPASSSSESPAASPRTPQATAAHERMRSVPSSPSSDPGPERERPLSSDGHPQLMPDESAASPEAIGPSLSPQALSSMPGFLAGGQQA